MSVTAVALRELHRLHRQLSDLRERLERGPKQIKAREVNLARLDGELNQIKAAAKAARVAADQKNLLLKSGDSKISDLLAKRNAASSNREYQALEGQIAADKMANSVLADEILEALERLDEYAKQVAEAEDKVLKAKEEFARVRAQVKEQQALLETDAGRLTADLVAAEAKLPGDFLDAYQRIVKGKGADAMAQVEGETCGGCCQTITPNRFSELFMGRVICCQSCGRLLYLPEDRISAKGR